ncbi:translation initiation factor eIF2B subunit delta-like [Amphiura filiformis]|uniref:translation initiation factor eIF2B subunit delta-like n=1 Tax=Amphiura filiformis TaxID=82378 RepID=UPI003B22830B
MAEPSTPTPTTGGKPGGKKSPRGDKNKPTSPDQQHPNQEGGGKRLSKKERREQRLKQQKEKKAEGAGGGGGGGGGGKGGAAGEKGGVAGGKGGAAGPVQEQKKVEHQQKGGDGGHGKEGGGVPQKSKAELKRERRAKQQADIAAKQTGKQGGQQQPRTNSESSTGAPESKSRSASVNAGQGKAKPVEASSLLKKEPPRISDDIQQDDPKAQKRKAKRLERHQIPQRTVSQKKVSLFAHLDQYERDVSLTKGLTFASGGIHPAILRLGLQYARGIICGANARSVAMLNAFKHVIMDYSTPPQKELSRDLESKLKPIINFLNQCRPKSVSMGNAIKYVKMQITHMPGDISDAEAKRILCEAIDNYVREKIILAAEAISKSYASQKIIDGDVILIFGCSSLIRKVLCDAQTAGKRFRVIVVDSRPKLEGKEQVRRLIEHGIKCSYVLMNSVSYMMQEVTKVLLGAHALLANGYVMSRVGSAMISMVAKTFNVPVLVCCETYKFSDRVQTDSFVSNELGDPEDLVAINKNTHYLKDWRDIQSLTILNLVYDVFPPDLISMVITEIGMLPCTSVPVVLRVKNIES